MGSPICILLNVTLSKSVVVEPSRGVVPTLNRLFVSSQKNTALSAADLFIIIPASVACDAFSFKVIMLSSTTKF